MKAAAKDTSRATVLSPGPLQDGLQPGTQRGSAGHRTDTHGTSSSGHQALLRPPGRLWWASAQGGARAFLRARGPQPASTGLQLQPPGLGTASLSQGLAGWAIRHRGTKCSYSQLGATVTWTAGEVLPPESGRVPRKQELPPPPVSHRRSPRTPVQRPSVRHAGGTLRGACHTHSVSRTLLGSPALPLPSPSP